jgi:hypothetical protein
VSSDRIQSRYLRLPVDRSAWSLRHDASSPPNDHFDFEAERRSLCWYRAGLVLRSITDRGGEYALTAVGPHQTRSKLRTVGTSWGMAAVPFSTRPPGNPCGKIRAPISTATINSRPLTAAGRIQYEGYLHCERRHRRRVLPLAEGRESLPSATPRSGESLRPILALSRLWPRATSVASFAKGITNDRAAVSAAITGQVAPRGVRATGAA